MCKPNTNIKLSTTKGGGGTDDAPGDRPAEIQGLRSRRRIPIHFIRPCQEVTPCNNLIAEPETTAAGIDNPPDQRIWG